MRMRKYWLIFERLEMRNLSLCVSMAYDFACTVSQVTEC
jgi:hypothetical protein